MASIAAPQDVQFSNPTTDISSTPAQPAQKPGFWHGVGQGAKNMVKGLFTHEGLLMAGAGIAACVAFPVAAPLILGGAALLKGGSKMYQGAKNHDSSQVGEGFFNASMGGLGVGASGALAGSKVSMLCKGRTASVDAGGGWSGAWAGIKAAFKSPSKDHIDLMKFAKSSGGIEAEIKIATQSSPKERNLMKYESQSEAALPVYGPQNKPTVLNSAKNQWYKASDRVAKSWNSEGGTLNNFKQWTPYAKATASLSPIGVLVGGSSLNDKAVPQNDIGVA